MQIVIATTTSPADDLIQEFASRMDFPVHRGSETNVLERYQEAADRFGASTIVRVTSDCPLIDPEVIDRCITRFGEEDLDYLSNFGERTFPRGLETEVMTAEALAIAHGEAGRPEEREHVTPYIYRNPGRFKIGTLRSDIPAGHERWTVDTAEDLELIGRILDHCPDPTDPYGFSWLGVRDCLDRHPEWRNINANIRQKAIRSD